MAVALGGKGQISLEFVVVYSLVLVIFTVVFGLVTSSRAAELAQQQNSFLQLVVQDVATGIQQTVSSGNGYSMAVQLPTSISSAPYSLYITSTGIVLANMSVTGQVLSAQASSGIRNLFVGGTALQSNGPIRVYSMPVSAGSIAMANYFGAIYVDAPPPGFSGVFGALAMNATYTSNSVTLYLHALSASGSNLTGARISVIARQGSAVQVASGLANTKGNVTITLSPNNIYPTENVSIYATVLGGTAAGSLVSWFPLMSVFGNVTYDLSGSGSTGLVTNDIFGAFKKPWVPMRQNATNLQVASFNSVDEVNATSSAINTTLNASDTVSFWMNWSGTTPETPFSFYQGYNLSASTCMGFNAGSGDNYGFPANGLSGRWVFVTAEFYNGPYTGNTAIYINGVNQSLSQCSGTPTTSQATDNVIMGGWKQGYRFTGSMSNVQLYSGRLSQAQVSGLYGEGLDGAPLSTGILAGWWPLDGNTNDYSPYNSGGTTPVQFANYYYYTNSPTYVLDLSSGQYGVYGANVASARLGVNPSTLGTVNFSVNQWFMLANAVSPYSSVLGGSSPVVDIYDGSTNNGIGAGQSFDFGGSWAGGSGGRFSWGEYGPTSWQSCSTPANTVRANAWYDALVSVSGYTNVTIYLDGQRAANCTFTGVSASTLSSSSANLMLGLNDNPTGTDELGQTYISDVELYGNVLTARQAQQLYGYGTPFYAAVGLGG